MNKNLYFYRFTFVSRSCVRTSLSYRHKAISRWRGPGPHYHLSPYIGQKTGIRAVHRCAGLKEQNFKRPATHDPEHRPC